MSDVAIGIYNGVIALAVTVSFFMVLGQDDYPAWLKAVGAIGVLLIGALLIVSD